MATSTLKNQFNSRNLSTIEFKHLQLMIKLDLLICLQERIQLETARLYKLAGINPLAGVQIVPVFRAVVTLI